jgi:hypothetical protein
MRTTPLVAFLSSVAVAPGIAAGDPSIAIARDVPFDAAELSDALALRGTLPDAPIRVSRRGNQLVVEVGDRVEVVTAGDREPSDDARVVAMVIVGLGSMPETDHQQRDREEPAVPVAHEAHASPWSVRAGIARMRDDNGIFSTPLSASVTYRLAPTARVVIGAGLAPVGSQLETTTSVPIRLGVEGRAGSVGIELGGVVAPAADCNGSLAAATGGYGALRVYLPLGQSAARLFVEGGGQYMFDQRVGCERMQPSSTLTGESYAGELGLGVEWPL